MHSKWNIGYFWVESVTCKGFKKKGSVNEKTTVLNQNKYKLSKHLEVILEDINCKKKDLGGSHKRRWKW